MFSVELQVSLSTQDPAGQVANHTAAVFSGRLPADVLDCMRSSLRELVGDYVGNRASSGFVGDVRFRVKIYMPPRASASRGGRRLRLQISVEAREEGRGQGLMNFGEEEGGERRPEDGEAEQGGATDEDDGTEEEDRGAVAAPPSAIVTSECTKGEQEREDCTICLESMAAAAEGCHLPCGHIFHADCIRRWSSISCQCPLCRRCIHS